MLFKEKVYSACCELLRKNISSLKGLILELEQGAENDSKSSAGDKHETARSMMQLEQEKLSKQLDNSLLLLADFEKTGITSASEKVSKGSLVTTNRGIFLFGPALGKIVVESIPVICLSPQSPLGGILMGLGVNERAEINGTIYIVEQIQ